MRCYEDPVTDGDDDDRVVHYRSKHRSYKSRSAAVITFHIRHSNTKYIVATGVCVCQVSVFLSVDAFLCYCTYCTYFSITLGNVWRYPVVVHLEIISDLCIGFVAMTTYMYTLQRHSRQT